jgi:ubiquinone/menaquinone biosynthesis C-methylase UbiE
VRAALDRAAAAWPRLLDETQLTGRGTIADLLGHPLLGLTLEAAPLNSAGFERLLTNCRAILLARSAALESSAPIRPALIAALASYVPLHTLPSADRLLERKWPAPVDDLLTQQVREPRRERELVSGLRRLTPIDDRTSLLVQEQYEENPFPRWVRTGILRPPADFGAYWRDLFPDAPVVDGYEILIAGCGTGRQAVEAGMRFPSARILAIDFSRTSLAYALRKSEELGIGNVEFAQADILRIGSIGRTFDVVYSDGVLHHLREPERGWSELVKILKPGGAMHISLYSELARTRIVEAQRLAEAQGYSGKPDEIRAFRQHLLTAEPGSPLAWFAGIPDLYSLSECRDLLFHRQEHRFTIPRIREFIADAGVEFVGFDVDEDVARAFTQRYSAKSATDFSKWTEFEQDRPLTFLGMYQLWLRKPGAG